MSTTAGTTLIEAALAYIAAGRAHLAALNVRGSLLEASRFINRPEWQALEAAAAEFEREAARPDVRGLEVLLWRSPAVVPDDDDPILVFSDDSGETIVEPAFRLAGRWRDVSGQELDSGLIHAWCDWPFGPAR